MANFKGRIMTNPNVRNIDGLPVIMGQLDTFARTTTERAMAEIGITVVDGSFEKGATGVTKGTGVYQESTGKVFQWQLTNTFNITAGTLPSDYGTIGTDWVDRTSETLRGEINIVVRRFATISEAVANSSLIEGDTIELEERVIGGGGGAVWDVALTSSVTPNGFDVVQCTSVPTLSLVLRDTTGDIRKYGDLNAGNAIVDGLLQAVADHVGFAKIHKGVVIRVSTIPTTLKSIDGGGRLIWDNNAASIITYVMPAGFRVEDIEIETVYRSRLAIKADNLKVYGVREIQSDTRTDIARYNCVEWVSDSDISINRHRTANTGLRAMGGGVVSIDDAVLFVNNVGQGPGANDNGVDGIKCSGLSGVNINNVKCYGSSRDVIDTYIGGGACNISNIWADGFYFNEIEIKSQGTAAADNQITPHDINISNIYVGSGGNGSLSNFAALFLYNQTEGSVLNSPRRVNVSNWNSRLIGAGASATYHGVYALGAYDLNFTNVNLLSAEHYGMTLTRCNSVKISNSNLHGKIRGATIIDCKEVSIINSTLGEDREASTISTHGLVFAGSNNNIKLSNSTVKGSTRGISGEGATVNYLKVDNSEIYGANRIDIFDGVEFSNSTLDGRGIPGGADVLFTDANTPSTKLKIIGGTVKNGRYGINQQSLSKFACIGVDFENLTSPMGGIVSNNNRRVVNCLSDAAGSFPTASGSDVITGNIVL